MSGAEASLRVKVKVGVSEPALLLAASGGAAHSTPWVCTKTMLPASSRGVPWGATDTALTLMLVQACGTGNRKCMSVSEPFLRPA